jgi:hypothetical protein
MPVFTIITVMSGQEKNGANENPIAISMQIIPETH